MQKAFQAFIWRVCVCKCIDLISYMNLREDVDQKHKKDSRILSEKLSDAVSVLLFFLHFISLSTGASDWNTFYSFFF